MLSSIGQNDNDNDDVIVVDDNNSEKIATYLNPNKLSSER